MLPSIPGLHKRKTGYKSLRLRALFAIVMHRDLARAMPSVKRLGAFSMSKGSQMSAAAVPELPIREEINRQLSRGLFRSWSFMTMMYIGLYFFYRALARSADKAGEK